MLNNTTTTWTTLEGVNGRLCTASNGNNIFLPAAGLLTADVYGSFFDLDNGGYYWSRSLETDGSNINDICDRIVHTIQEEMHDS